MFESNFTSPRPGIVGVVPSGRNELTSFSDNPSQSLLFRVVNELLKIYISYVPTNYDDGDDERLTLLIYSRPLGH